MSMIIAKKGTKSQTLIDVLRDACEDVGAQGILYINDKSEEEWISYRDLWMLASTYGAILRSNGVEQGDRVAIILPTSKEFLGAFWGSVFVGAIPFALYPPSVMVDLQEYQAKIRRIFAQAEPRVVVTIPAIKSVVLNALEEDTSTRICLPKDFEGEWVEQEPASVSPKDLAFLQFTSGSTSAPRGVRLTHANVMANVEAIAVASKMTREDVGVSWLPPYHDMGLIGKIIECAYMGVKLIWMSPMYFLRRPVRWLEAITRYGGTMSAAPNFAYSLCVRKVRESDLERLDLSTWRLAFNGAEPIDPRVTLEFIRKFSVCGFRPTTMYPVYGLAESSLAVTFPEPGSELVLEHIDREKLSEDGEASPVEEGSEGSITLVSCGRPVPTTRLKIVDEGGEELPERRVGEIVIQGPSVTEGYYRNEEETRRSIRDGWFYTGDKGYIAGGNLFVTGRIKDMIIIRGRNYLPQDIEQAVEQVEGVRRGRVVAFSVYDKEQSTEYCAIAAETEIKEEGSRRELRERICRQVRVCCGVSPKEVILLQPGALPKTSSGKLQRSLTKKLYLEGELVQRCRKSTWRFLFCLFMEWLKSWRRRLLGR